VTVYDRVCGVLGGVWYVLREGGEDVVLQGCVLGECVWCWNRMRADAVSGRLFTPGLVITIVWSLFYVAGVCFNRKLLESCPLTLNYCDFSGCELVSWITELILCVWFVRCQKIRITNDFYLKLIMFNILVLFRNVKYALGSSKLIPRTCLFLLKIIKINTIMCVRFEKASSWSEFYL